MRCLEQTLSGRPFYGVEIQRLITDEGAVIKENLIPPRDVMDWAGSQFGICTSLEPNIDHLVWYWANGVMWFNSEEKRNLFLLRWS